MQINLNQLRAFHMAVRYKSISIAAEKLYVTPAAVSMQIKKLEQWLGERLLERSSNAFTVTKEGIFLQNYAQTIFGGVERLEQAIISKRRDQSGELCIGMHNFPARYFMPVILMELKNKYPNIKLHIEHGTREELIKKIFQHKIQIALVFGEIPQGLRGIPLRTDPLVLVSSPRSLHISQGEIKYEDISDIPIFLQEEGTGVSQGLLNFFKEEKIKPKILISNICSDVIKQFISIDLGLAFIIEFAIKKEIHSGELRKISLRDRSPAVSLHAIYEESASNQFTVQAALDAFASMNLQEQVSN